MISYKPSDLAALETKPYNVWNGLGFWFLSLGVYIWMLGLFVSTRATIDKAIAVGVAFLMISGLVGSFFVKLGRLILARAKNLENHLFVLILCTILSVFATWCVTIILVIFIYGVIQALLHPTMDADAEENKGSDVVKLFGYWDPIKSYGLIMVLYSIIGLIGPIYLLTQNNCELALIVALLLLLCGIVGWNLIKKKEWARSLTICLHLVLAAIPCLLMTAYVLPYKTRSNDVMTFSYLLVTIGIFPFYHWMYFVIRALSHPVVKSEFLRGGKFLDA